MIAIILMAVMLMSVMLLSACGGGDTATEPEEKPESTGTDDSTNTETGDQPVIKILFTKGGFDPPPPNDPIKEELEKRSGVKFEQIAPPISDYAQKVNAILASGSDLPDIVKLPTHRDLFTYAKQGALLSLDDWITEEKAPNILKDVPQTALDKCRVDGVLYGIPIWCSPNRYNFIVRGDWLKKLKLEEPKTLDDLYLVLKAFSNDDPDGNGKKDSYGLSGQGFEAFMPIFGAFGVVKDYWYEENGQLLPYNLHPDMKRALEYIHQLQNEGFVDPEWVSTTTEAQLNEKAMKNQFGATAHWWTWEPKVEMEMKKVDPNVEFRRIAPPIGPDGKSGLRGVAEVNTVISVLSTTKYPEECIKFLDYLHTENGMLTQYTGVEGLHWEKKSDGTVVTLPQFDEDQKWIQWYSLFENESPLLLVETPLVQSRRDAFKWPIIVNAADGIFTEADLKYGNDIRAYTDDMFTKFIYGEVNIDQFDEFTKQWREMGGDEWIKEINDAYKKQNN
jgi:putative aldouronate transport system substrate-binding protein